MSETKEENKNNFIEEIKFTENFPPFKKDDKIYFGGEKEVQKMIEFYLKNKGVENYKKNSERFKINCVLGNNGGGKSRLLKELERLKYQNINNNYYDDDYDKLGLEIIEGYEPVDYIYDDGKELYGNSGRDFSNGKANEIFSIYKNFYTIDSYKNIISKFTNISKPLIKLNIRKSKVFLDGLSATLIEKYSKEFEINISQNLNTDSFYKPFNNGQDFGTKTITRASLINEKLIFNSLDKENKKKFFYNFLIGNGLLKTLLDGTDPH